MFESIFPTIKYHPKKANVLTNALSQIQRKEVEDSMDDPTVVATTIEEQVSALSGFSIELMVEDLQKWTKAYKEGKGHIAASTKLCQGQKYEDFYLTPSGMMTRMVGVKQKSIVPKSLRQ